MWGGVGEFCVCAFLLIALEDQDSSSHRAGRPHLGWKLTEELGNPQWLLILCTDSCGGTEQFG